MDAKSRVKSRLEKIKNLEGVFPTAGAAGAEIDAGTREEFRSIARSMRAQDFGEAAARSGRLLQSALAPADVIEPAVELFSGSTGLREQFAGFAQAGINFFHGSASYARMSLGERRGSGGNGSIQRVMIEETRVLLEPQRLIVRFESGVKAPERRALFEKHGLAPIETGGLPPRTFRTACSRGFALDIAVELMTSNLVAFAEPDFVEHIGTRAGPDDPLLAEQWHHEKIDGRAAWDVTTGEGVRIVVIDNGFDATHPDLAFGSLSGWFRPSADFVDADFVRGIVGMPDQDHGTACAGMIGARAGNGVGGRGVAFGADLSMVACLIDQVGTQTTLARAIGYAARPATEKVKDEAGADIVVCSLGPNSAAWTMSETLSDAIDLAAAKGRGGKGTMIFWACTNGNFPVSADQVCSHPRVCAVGRSTSADLDNGSGFGPELDFLAPGVNVLIPSSGGDYAKTTGTSFAAPCAAAVAALALSQNLALRAGKLRTVMRDSCDKVGPLPYVDGRNPRFGHGRVNARKAVEAARTLGAGA